LYDFGNKAFWDATTILGSCIVHKLHNGCHGSFPCFLWSLICSLRQPYRRFGCRILCFALA
jgi:hypothetical protein